MEELIHQIRHDKSDYDLHYRDHEEASHGLEVNKGAPKAFSSVCCFFVHGDLQLLKG